MGDRILVTGGAGFIGSHVVDRLISRGCDVTVLDSLEPQVHRGGEGFRNPQARFIEGSVLDPHAIRNALKDANRVVHLAAQVGVGQSMYQMSRYVGENSLGTAVFLEAVAEQQPPLEALVVASSMSIYGEGLYRCPHCADAHHEFGRSVARLRQHLWEPVCLRCGHEAVACATNETKPLHSDSVYATTKKDQEELCLIFGRSRGVRTVALRFFNVYGPRQSLSNPYTGVAAIFASRVLNGQPPIIYEDGLQSRDFIHVSDIVQGIEAALFHDSVGDVALNLGTGIAVTVRHVAETLTAALGSDLQPSVLGQFRAGDIRHCYADITAARQHLDYAPRVSFRDGMAELTTWIREDAPPSEDFSAIAAGELAQRGLVS